MKIDKKTFHRIIDRTKGNFTSQVCRLYWDSSKKKELSFDEKRLLSYIKIISDELDLNLEIEYFE